MIIEIILAVLLGLASIVVVVGIMTLIVMPFVGAMVRWRANYNPKSVGLDNITNSAGPTLTSLWGTLKRTKQLEGWYGIYKGAYVYITLALAESLVFGVIAAIMGVTAMKHNGEQYQPTITPGIILGASLITILLSAILVPATVILNRCIVTPYRLPTNPSSALRIILSPSELEKPYRLYLTPGLLPVVCLQTLSLSFLASLVRYVLIGSMAGGGSGRSTGAQWQGPEPTPLRIDLFIAFQIISTAWLVPLDVVATRLSVQPYSPRGDHYASLGQKASDQFELNEEGGAPHGLEYCGDGEDVIALRPVTEPYEGMIDCARKLASEEGVGSLYRGWIWSLLGNVLQSGG